MLTEVRVDVNGPTPINQGPGTGHFCSTGVNTASTTWEAAYGFSLAGLRDQRIPSTSRTTRPA